MRSSQRLFKCHSVYRIHGSTNALNKSFLRTAISYWNALPNDTVMERNYVKFKDSLLQH